MLMIGTDVVGSYFVARAGHAGIKVARSQYDAWLRIAMGADWRNPDNVKVAYPKASILKGGRVGFKRKGNDFRHVAAV